MIEYFNDNPHYVVLIVATVLWLGVLVFLLRIDRRLTEIEKTTTKFQPSSSTTLNNEDENDTTQTTL